ncbi:right-handed parallel beta-helix repeat-containing protein [Luteolibacter marinus]|uniref:right-handed parallel beta-helix repeat-containing protein n=1 Tax=Luteolibacter marinus TaxID=2776705 RepID=UPI001867F23E|nr:right-handed parallel beta-helix repeat-containing protein [Luteolibacter marinus]
MKLRHYSILSIPAARRSIALAILASSGIAAATTAYVDQANAGDPAMNGTAAHPYDTIQAAISDLFLGADDILVYPGTYHENLTITKNVTLRSHDGPHTTLIDGSKRSPHAHGITFNESLNVTIEGFTISGAQTGIYQPARGSLTLKNLILVGNTGDGVLAAAPPNSSERAKLVIYNCVFAANTESGIQINNYYSYPTNYHASMAAYNNIFIGNGSYGIEMGANSSYDGSGSILIDYNNAIGNTAGNYNTNLSTRYSTGAHSISTSPTFVGGTGPLTTRDFRLVPGNNPCIDSGMPGLSWLDPDGTRNDMGAYGGPGAQRFYTSPNDGPFIRDVTIREGLVPKGSTFTIDATGAVR